jgi:TolB-like protein
MQPTHEEVRAELERLLASDALAGAARLRRFLSFIVDRALEGEGRQLKEYAVGIEVFDRGSDYDPRIDSIVRVEAGRLRARLDEYYSHAGQDDAVIVRIPRGGYTPVFERRSAPVAGAGSTGPDSAASESSGRRVRWIAFAGVATATLVLVALARLAGTESAAAGPTSGVRVAVLPFAHYSADPAVGLLAARLTDGVMSELVRTGRVHVVSRTSTLQSANGPRSLKDVARALNASLLVEGSVHVDADRVRVQVRMVDPDVDRKLSLHEFEGARQDLDELQRRIAAAIHPPTGPALPR